MSSVSTAPRSSPRAVSAHVFEGADLHAGVVDGLIEGNVDPSQPYRNSESPVLDLITGVTS